MGVVVVMIGVICTMNIIKRIYHANVVSNAIEEFGRNSMGFYIIHGFILMVIVRVTQRLGTPVDMIIYSCFVVVLCIPCINLIKKYVPILIGAKKEKI
jgi:fucose 4-O-acetylase-like acetyltransferase